MCWSLFLNKVADLRLGQASALGLSLAQGFNDTVPVDLKHWHDFLYGWSNLNFTIGCFIMNKDSVIQM